MDPRERKWEEDGAEGNIWNQERGSERRMVFLGTLGPKRQKVRGGQC